MKYTPLCKKTLELGSSAKMGTSDGNSLVQMCIVKVAQNMDVLEKKVSSEFYLQQNHFLVNPKYVS